MTAWKRTERAIAKRLGGKRVGITGSATPDVVTETLAVEVKHRKRLPGWLTAAVRQAAINGNDRLPLVILHESGAHHENDLVVMRMKDLERLLTKP